MADKVITPEGRVSFPNVFRPAKAMQEGAEPKYGLTLLFPKDADLTALRKAAHEVCVEKWGADKAKWPKNLRSPFRDQGEKEYDGYEEGAIFINVTSRQRPGIVDAKMNEIIDETDFYGGCYARASVNAFAYDKAGNRGVAFGLNNVQKLRDGEPFSGRTKPQDDFEPVAGAGSSGNDDLFE